MPDKWDEATERLRGEPDPPTEPDLLAGVRNGAWLDAQTFEPLVYAVDGVVAEGFNLLVGPPKIGKSWLGLDFGLAVGSGGRAMGTIQVGTQPVFYLALEDGHRRLQDRCRVLNDGQPTPARLEYLTTVQPRLILDTIEAWLDQRSDGCAPLVILDTLGRVMPPAQPGETTYGRDYRIGVALKRLADTHPGTAVLVNHHDRKAAADDFVDAVSGTHGLAGAADTVIVLGRGRGENTGLLKVTGRDVPEDEYALHFDGYGSWRLDGANLPEAADRARQQRASLGLGDRSAQIVAYIGEHPEGVYASDIEQAFGITHNSATTYLTRLYNANRIERPVRGLYTPVGGVTSVTPLPKE